MIIKLLMHIETHFMQQNNEKNIKPISHYDWILAIPGSMCNGCAAIALPLLKFSCGMQLLQWFCKAVGTYHEAIAIEQHYYAVPMYYVLLIKNLCNQWHTPKNVNRNRKDYR